ncbi:MAG: BamA/TamA family outer membrane protein [Betaproteobacteria bacterium]|nr:BamA/TamA family outer membrane protein [Betaproteobacteria bacterium]
MEIVRMRRILLAIVVGFCSVATGALAQSGDTQGGPHFEIRHYVVKGASLLPDARLQAVLKPYTGERRDFNDVQKALRAVEAAYAKAGYTAVQVVLPEQELVDGRVILEVHELRIGRLVVEGNQHFDDANIRQSLPDLQPGKAPNVDAIARNLRTANENPSKSTTVLLRSSETEGAVDAVARVVDQKPWRAAISVDTTGTPATGTLRTGVSAQHANLFNRDQVLSAQYITSPRYPSHVTIVGLGYHIPLYTLGDSLDLAYVYSDVNSGQTETSVGTLAISGGGQFYSARYNANLPRRGNWDQKFVFGADWRDYTNNVHTTGSSTSLIPDVSVHPLSIGYSGRRRTQQDDLSLFLSAYRNIPGRTDGNASGFARSRSGATPAYTVWRYGASYLRSLPRDWQARVSVSGQYTADMLIAGEQFGIGGMDSVRGFLEREIANDRGTRSSVELYTPEFGLGADHGFRSRGLAFFDYGYVARNSPLPGELSAETIASYGLGLRGSFRDVMSVRLDVGNVYQAGGTQNKGDKRLQGVVSVFF